MSRERFTFTVEAIGTYPPPAVRVRRFLKSALRCYGLKCVAIAAVTVAQDVQQQIGTAKDTNDAGGRGKGGAK